MLFGSEQFAKYVGKMHLAMKVDEITKDMDLSLKDPDKPELQNKPAADKAGKKKRNTCRMKRWQHRREVKLAMYLKEKLDRYVIGRDEQGFLDSISREARE